MAQTPLPKTTDPGGLVNADVNNGQQKANFQSVWSFLEWLFGSTGSRASAFSTVAAEGGTIGGNVSIQGNVSNTGDVTVGDDLSVADNIATKTITLRSDPDAQLQFYERNFAGSLFVIYAADGKLRIWHNDVGDLLTIDIGGNLVVKGNITMTGL